MGFRYLFTHSELKFLAARDSHPSSADPSPKNASSRLSLPRTLAPSSMPLSAGFCLTPGWIDRFVVIPGGGGCFLFFLLLNLVCLSFCFVVLALPKHLLSPTCFFFFLSFWKANPSQQGEVVFCFERNVLHVDRTNMFYRF